MCTSRPTSGAPTKPPFLQGKGKGWVASVSERGAANVMGLQAR